MKGEFERSLPAGRALDHARGLAARLGFHLQLEAVGGELKTTFCQLTGPDSKTAPGTGKGIGEQSMASAVWEAFEHYHYLHEELPGKLSLRQPSSDFPEWLLRQSSPDFQLVLGRHSPPLSCVEFQGYEPASGRIHFPIILTKPDFVPSDPAEKSFEMETRFCRYGTNSGTAAGASLAEAQLHGLLEVIERDALSITFLKSIISPHPQPVCEIKRDTLEDSLRELCEKLRQETGGEITLWDITTDIGIPCALCALSFGSPTVQRYFGSGASLRPDYAIVRALLEALQCFHGQKTRAVRPRAPIKPVTQRMSLYQRCALGTGYFEYRGGARLMDYQEFASRAAEGEMPVDGQVKLILEQLIRLDMRAFYRVIEEKNLFVVQTVVPQLERFQVVAHGIPVAPGWRGRKTLEMLAKNPTIHQSVISIPKDTLLKEIDNSSAA